MQFADIPYNLGFDESPSRFIEHPYSLISHYLVLVEGL